VVILPTNHSEHRKSTLYGTHSLLNILHSAQNSKETSVLQVAQKMTQNPGTHSGVQDVQNVSERGKVSVSEQKTYSATAACACSSACYEPTSLRTLWGTLYSRLSESVNLYVRHFDLSWLPV
jgi:hypothetical protein